MVSKKYEYIGDYIVVSRYNALEVLSSKRFYTPGTADGYEITFYQNGAIKTFADLRNDKYDGLYKEFYEVSDPDYSPSIKAIYAFNNGDIEGPFVEYYHPEKTQGQPGVIKTTGSYSRHPVYFDHNRFLVGAYQSFHPNKAPHISATYITTPSGPKLTGTFQKQDSEGNVIEFHTYNEQSVDTTSEKPVKIGDQLTKSDHSRSK